MSNRVNVINLCLPFTLLWVCAEPAQAQFTGCPAGPYYLCVNPVPATYLSGSWLKQTMRRSGRSWPTTAGSALVGSV